MICPYCGSEIKDDHIYCDVCGKEFQIVPDFDFEVEENMSESMKNIKEDVNMVDKTTQINIDDSYLEEDEEYFLEEEPDFIGNFLSHIARKKIVLFSVIGVGVLLIFFIVFGIVQFYHKNSYDYQYDKALVAIENGNYGEAVEYLDQALMLDGSNIEVKMMLANCFVKTDNYDSALLILREVIAEDPKNIDAYMKIVSIYENNKEYQKIADLFAECTDEDILKNFQSHTAAAPEFSVESGTYSDLVTLKLMAGTNGTIFYTTDGTEPDNTSTEYTVPIVFDKTGQYTVSAVFVNTYGVKSEVVTKEYTIDFDSSPLVNLDSNRYDLPQLITIDVPEGHTAYYTIDAPGETVPDDSSNQYLAPIWMQLGTHVYQFVIYSPNGIPGEVITRTYTLSMNTLHDAASSLQQSKQFLVNYGFILDLEGHLKDKPGHNEYTCTTAFIYNEVPYFLIEEFYIDTSGEKVRTDNLWAYDANDTRFYRAYTTKESENDPENQEKDGLYWVVPIQVDENGQGM